MAETASSRRPGIGRLILVPALISLAITLIRLTGELLNWSDWWFSRAPGGGGSPIGISWLVPIFGIYFALRLSRAGDVPASGVRAVLFALLGIGLLVVGGFVAFAPQVTFPGRMIIGLLMMAAAAAIPFFGWPRLARTLLAYGYAARIPVAILMFFAIRGQWGTHYDVLPPGFNDAGFWPTYFWIAFLPQMLFWVVFTVVIGSLFGSVAGLLARRRMPATEAAVG